MNDIKKRKKITKKTYLTGANRSTNPIVVIYSHSKKSLKNKVAAVCYNTIGAVATPYPLVAIPTVIIFPMKLTRKWFLIIVSAVTPVIYRLFIYECSIYSKLGIKKKNLSMKKKTFWYYVCDMMLSKPSSQRVALIWAAAAASRNSPIL